jgi:hypothetical protein
MQRYFHKTGSESGTTLRSDEADIILLIAGTDGKEEIMVWGIEHGRTFNKNRHSGQSH